MTSPSPPLVCAYCLQPAVVLCDGPVGAFTVETISAPIVQSEAVATCSRPLCQQHRRVQSSGIICSRGSKGHKSGCCQRFSVDYCPDCDWRKKLAKARPGAIPWEVRLLLDDLHAAKLQLRIDGERIFVSPPEGLTDHLRAELKRLRPQLLEVYRRPFAVTAPGPSTDSPAGAAESPGAAVADVSSQPSSPFVGSASAPVVEPLSFRPDGSGPWVGWVRLPPGGWVQHCSGGSWGECWDALLEYRPPVVRVDKFVNRGAKP